MIQPAPGVVFTTADDGDMRADPAARMRLGLPTEWATVRQVHGADVRHVHGPGDHGAADGLRTTIGDLPLAVFTADCLGVVLHGDGEVAVIHAGWRGVVAGIVENAVAALGDIDSVHVGPHIRPCCFEVGPEVAELFPGHTSTTTWGTQSVDLAGAVASRLPVAPVISEMCTRCGDGYFSHRRDGTSHRLAAIGWVA